MTVRKCLLAGWLSLGAGAMASGQDAPRILNLEERPTVVAAPAESAIDVQNQRTAEAIVAAIGKNGKLAGYKIDVVFVDGVAELRGQVNDALQRDLANATARSVPGVIRVDDQLSLVRGDIAVTQDQVPVLPKDGPSLGGAFPPAPAQVSPPFQPNPGMPVPGMPVPGMPVPGMPHPGMPGGPGASIPFGPIPNNPYPAPAATMTNHPGMMPNPQYQPPPLPPYAWPTYAPYNNYSRVANPLLHTYNQWPFIGPMYPYPKIPLGWRRVTLEWQDGSWWYGRESNSHDWWRIRYW